MTPEEAARNPALIPLKFWTEYEDVKDKPGETKATDWVLMAKRGTNGQTLNERVERIRKHDPAIWSVIERAYEHWKKGQEEPATGTSLSAWPGCNAGMADRLRALHLRTVEDVAAMTDSDMERVGMGARELRTRAQTFMEAKKGQAVVAEAMAQKDEQIASLSAQIKELTETVQALAADRPKRQKPGDVANKSAA